MLFGFGIILAAIGVVLRIVTPRYFDADPTITQVSYAIIGFGVLTLIIAGLREYGRTHTSHREVVDSDRRDHRTIN